MHKEIGFVNLVFPYLFDHTVVGFFFCFVEHQQHLGNATQGLPCIHVLITCKQVKYNIQN